MALVLNEEQRLLKDTAREFVTGHAPVEALRSLRDQREELGYSPSLWQQMGELGWAGITLPEAWGGLEFGYLGLGAVLEEAGRTLTASPLLATVVLGASAIELAGNDEQRERWLPRVAEGALTLALAVDEGPHHAPEQTALQARRQGDRWVLEGSKAYVIDGHAADLVLVVARSAGKAGEREGLSLFAVAGDAAGLQRQRLWMADSRGYAHLEFNQVEVAADALLGEADQAWPVLDQVLDRGRIALAAEMLGNGLEAFERTIDYLKEREQFGAPIGSFQALKHRAAIMFCELEMSRSVVLDALSAIDEDRADLAQMASLAKARLNEVLMQVSNEAVQMHGGIGVTDELEIGFFLKRARVAMQLLGDAGFHRDRYASLCGY